MAVAEFETKKAFALRTSRGTVKLDRTMEGPAKQFTNELRAEPLQVRYAVVGILVAGFAGAVAGLVIGLQVYAATAWGAMLELGIPSAIAGGAVGFLAGHIVAIVRRHRRDNPDLAP